MRVNRLALGAAARSCYSSLASSSSGIRLIMDAAWELEQSIRERVWHLEVGQPSFAAPDCAVKEACTAVEKKVYQSYIPNDGISLLKDTVAAKARQHGKLHLTEAHNVVITPGCVAALFTAFGSVIESAGNEILVPNPGWPNYEMGIRLLKGKPVTYDLNHLSNGCLTFRS